jgi:hypothetical protein
MRPNPVAATTPRSTGRTGPGTHGQAVKAMVVDVAA